MPLDNDRRKEDIETKMELREFIAENRQWQKHTDDYRKDLNDKIEKLNKKIDEVKINFYSLPCKEREGLFDSIKNQLRAIWVLLVGIIMSIVGAYFKK